jgi:hypothetical protein
MAGKFGFLNKFLKAEADDAARMGKALSKEEAEVAADLLKQPGMSQAYDDVLRQNKIDDARAAFTEQTPAADAFRTFDEANMVPGTVAGDVTLSTSRPNFNLQGQPYSKNFPAAVQDKGLVPVDQAGKGIVKIDPTNTGLPVVGRQMDDVIDVTARNVDAAPVMDKASFLQKYGKKGAIGAGLAGAGILGISALQDEQPQQAAPTVQPLEPTKAQISTPPTTETPPASTGMTKTASLGSGSLPGTPQQDPLKVLDFGTGFKDTAAALQEQQQMRNDAWLANQLSKAGSQLGAAIAGVKTPDLSLFDENIKQADSVVNQYKERMEKEKTDPNSPLSKGMKQFMKSFGFDVQGDASAEELMKLSPLAERYYQSVENREARIAADRQRSLDRQAQLQIAKMNKEAETGRKRGEKLEGYTMQMRKDLTSGPLAKQYTAVVNSKTALGDLTEFMKNPTGYSDYGTLMRSLKVLQGDDSVVREAEMRLGQNAGSLGQKLQNYVDQMATGRSLRPEQRQDIINTLKIMDSSATDLYKQAAQPYLEQARELGLNENYILPGIMRDSQGESSSKKQDSVQKSIVKKQYSPSRNQTRVIYSDGSQEVLDGQQ